MDNEKKCKECGTTENVNFDGMCKKCYEKEVDKAIKTNKKIEENENKTEENNNNFYIGFIRLFKR